MRPLRLRRLCGDMTLTIAKPVLRLGFFTRLLDQADARRPGSDLGEKHKRCRQAAFVLVKMVLRHPCGVKAAAIGMHDLRGGQAIAHGCIRLIEQAGEKAKAQGRLRYGPCHVPGRRRSRSGRIETRQEFTW